MCGICGYIDFEKEPRKEVLLSMTHALRSRGPDETGLFLDQNIALGHARLSIIDLHGGKQPIQNEDSSIVIIQNGEFYNFIECRKELERSGHQFRTRSDAEVLVHLYEEKGLEAIRHINGMFAFALYDKKKGLLILGRDRMGQKPLYYASRPGTFLFASEMKSLMNHPAATKNLDRPALLKYFFYDYLPGKNTMFAGIHKLSAGSVLIVNTQDQSVQEKPFWNVPLFSQNKMPSFTEAKENLTVLLDSAVEKRLRSDVPVGIFLSGGLDSSIIASLMKKHTRQENIHTFSIGYKESSYDESTYSRMMSDHLKTWHHHFILNEEQAAITLKKIKSYLDEPFADPSLVPTFFLAEHARKYVKVVLGGDGGDELFAGYPGFSLLKLLTFLKPVKPLLKGMLQAASPFFHTKESYGSQAYFCRKLINSFAFSDPVSQVMSLFGSFSLQELSRLTGHDIKETKHIVLEDLEKDMATRGNESPVRLLQYALARFYLRDGVLVKVDRASMANSLEVRSPFLDHNLVEYAFQCIPHNYAFKRFHVKHILKKAFEKEIPSAIIRRPKQGFAMPLSHWLKTAFRSEVEKYLSKPAVTRHGLFNADYVEHIVREHMEGKHDHRKKIWALLMFQYWAEKYY